MVGGEDGGVGETGQDELGGLGEALEGWVHVGVGGAGVGHHCPVEGFCVDGGDGWGGRLLFISFLLLASAAAGSGIRIHLLSPLLLQILVVGLPHVFSLQIGLEAVEEGGVAGDLAPLEFLPRPVRREFTDREVHVAWRDAVGDFVVEDGAEGGEDADPADVEEEDFGFCVGRRGHDGQREGRTGVFEDGVLDGDDG